jgi:hypothetical protein
MGLSRWEASSIMPVFFSAANSPRLMGLVSPVGRFVSSVLPSACQNLSEIPLTKPPTSQYRTLFLEHE